MVAYLKILFIALGYSVHTARWINQLQGLGWDIHLFPVEKPCRLHLDIRNVTLHGLELWRPEGLRADVKVAGLWPFTKGAFRAEYWLQRHMPRWSDRAWQLARTIRRLKPDIVHSLEMQRAGYMTLESRSLLRGRFPPWIYSSWGSDIYFFAKEPDHTERVSQVLAACDYLITDCQRDVALARKNGFRGTLLGVFPGVGGFDLEGMRHYRMPGPVAARRVVAVKGYHHWAGRALTALQAIHRCVDLLRNYEIVVFSPSPEVEPVVSHIAAVTGLRIRSLKDSPHVEILKLMGRARVAMGINVSDGTPNAMLEAMVMGALPLQSDTGSTAEWITDGVNGLLVSSEDPGAIEAALRRGLTDDDLVDRAAVNNARLVEERIAMSEITPKVVDAYKKVMRNSACLRV